MTSKFILPLLAFASILALAAPTSAQPASLANEAAQIQAQDDVSSLTGKELMLRVNERDDGLHVTRNLDIELTDRRGNVRIEKTRSFRKYFGEDKRTVLFYSDPSTVRGTGFLTFDYADPSVDDDQWLYLPALRKVRRISASDRGDYFLGTDFTYEEIKKEQKVEIADYTFERGEDSEVDGFSVITVESTPINEDVAKDLGYSRIVSRIDPTIWMSRQSDYYDLNGNHLKTIHIEEVETIDGIITVTQLHVVNHKTSHQTRLRTHDVDYEEAVDDRIFTQANLKRGL